MQLKLGDVFGIEIKNHDVLVLKTLWELLFIVTHNWPFTLWWAKEIVF